MALSLPQTFAFSCLPRCFWALIGVFLIIMALKDEFCTLKQAFTVFVVNLYAFLSIAYIARPCHSYIESLLIL